MAKIFGKNRDTDFAPGNLMSFGKSFSRMGGQPLDESEVWYDRSALETFAASDAAYVGMKVVYVDEQNNKVYQYSIELDGSLKEIGVAPLGDGATVDVNEDGVISLKGFSDAENEFLPRVKVLSDEDGNETSRTIEWVPVSAVVEGDGNTVTSVTAGDGSVNVDETVNAENDTRSYAVKVKVSAEEGNAVSLKDDGLYVETPEAYDDSAIKGRLDALESNTHVDDVVYDSETQKIYLVAGDTLVGDGFDASAFIKDGMIESVELTDNTLVITWNSAAGEKDVTPIDLSSLIDVYTAGNGIIITGKEVAIDTAVVATVEALNRVQEIADAAQTADEVNAAVSAALEPYAMAADVENTYATKEALEGVSNVASDAQNRVGIVEGKIDEITSVGGEPNVIERIKVNGLTQSVSNKEIDIAVPTKVTDLGDGAALQALAQQGVDDAATAQSTATEAVNQAQTNKNDIVNLGTQISSVNSSLSEKIGSLEARDSELAGKIAGLEGIDTTLQETVAGHAGSITKLQSKDIELASLIQGNTNKFNDYSTTEQMNTAISNALAGFDQSALEEAIAGNTEAITTEQERAIAKENELAGLISGNADKVAEAHDEIDRINGVLLAAIENEDDTALNSIKELAAWVSEHESEVLPAIRANTEAIEVLTGTGENSVQKIVSDAISAIPTATAETLGLVKASAEINVSEDGAMSIGTISTDKLVPGNSVLVLNGGTATRDVVTPVE